MGAKRSGTKNNKKTTEKEFAMNNITIKDFKKLLKTDASKFEGIVVSEGKISKGPYTFFITPLTQGEHKVDVLSCQYKSAPNTQKTYLGFVVDSSDVHFYSKVFSNMFFDKDCDDTDAILAMGKALYDELVKMNPMAKEDAYCRYEGNRIAFCRAVKGNPDYDNPYEVYGVIVCSIFRSIQSWYSKYNKFLVDYLANPTGWAERSIHEADELLPSIGINPFSSSMGANILNSERLAQKLVASYSVPGTKEEYYKKLYRSVSGHDYVQLLIEIDGDTISLEYPVESDLTSHTLVIEEALRTFVAKKRPSKKQKVENFLAKHNVEFATRIPVKYIREIYTPDMKNVLWKNPKFEGLTK